MFQSDYSNDLLQIDFVEMEEKLFFPRHEIEIAIFSPSFKLVGKFSLKSLSLLSAEINVQ